MDTERTRALGSRLLTMVTGHVMTMLVNVGHTTGLFEAALRGPATSAGLAQRAGLDERYVREWLGAMVTGEILDFDAATGLFTLPPEHAPLLTGATAANIGPTTGMLRMLAGLLPEVERCFTAGGGVPYAAYAAVAGEGLGATWRHIYDEQLIDGFLGRVPGLHDTLQAGARVLDLGCGTGHAINLMAQAFPASEFVGLDIATEAIALGEAERAAMALPNARFVVGDAAELAADPPFDVITTFDAVHDQRSPAAVLERVRGALAPDGVFVMVDAKFSSRLENNIGNPHAPLCYGISLLFCLPTSLADGEGAGLGAMWGQELACEMLAAAGFDDVQVIDSPRAQNCTYICRAAELGASAGSGRQQGGPPDV
ncbi:class I SAM-dependent methyltransferase [Pseudonocardia sp. GCM10023141]|uniref:class I SAM-dependent methyltransferase n=1 Tax=Pseudonocardia sp. GCM10023141 TaxID=3252653 RepID=UPI00361F0120